MKLFNPFKPYIVQIGENYYVRANWFQNRYYGRGNPRGHKWYCWELVLEYASHNTLEEAQKTLEKVKNNPKTKFIEQ